ncbi:beta-propeller fold lactonase family protein [Sunxiuqinia sp. A32]|uniref:beta-propeller fold lactonase family protein n=1 Tax=Sunxiuqinia sp. A32 TaxID=3461496 RepID=UPI004045799B
MRKTKLILLLIIILITLIIYFPGRKLARMHVNQKTAVEDHPLLCTSCHLYTQRDNFISKLINEDYCSPINMAVSNDGQKLYVVAQDAGELIIVDATQNQVLDKIKVGEHPHSIVLSKDGQTAYVSNEWADNISVVDLVENIVSDTLLTGNGPAGLALSADGKFLYAANSFSSDLSVINLEKSEEIKRLTTGNNPTGVAISPDGDRLYVTSRRAKIIPYGEPMYSELAKVSGKRKIVEKLLKVESAYMMENIDFTPSGDLALVSLIRPKNLIPTIQVERGWMMTNGFGIICKDDDGEEVVYQLLADEPNAYYADPFDIVVSPDGKRAFLSSSGTDFISVIEIDSIRSILESTSPNLLKKYANNLGISSRFVSKRIKTGSNPKGLVISPDGKWLYVAEQLADEIGVIDANSLEYIRGIDLGGPKRITVARRGRRILNSSGGTFQYQYSCYTCHPDTHEDGLVYNMAGKDMGRNVTNTQSLREIAGTGPFKWNGKNQTVYKQDGIRFSTVLTRTEQFSYPDLDALVAYIKTGIKYPPNLMYNPDGKLTDSQLRGKEIFERSVDNYGKPIPENGRCVTCHPAPYFSNFELADVGTLAVSDDSILFDTPHLNNIYSSAPYLHDGRAETLEEIWTIYGGEDDHGYVNDLTKIELNDLIEYLKSLSAPQLERIIVNEKKPSYETN